MITLTYSGGPTLALPEDLIWEDEFEWTPVSQAIAVTLTGSLLIESSAQTAGRPVTLAGSDRAGWISRATLLTLLAWAAVAGRVHTLALNDGRSVSVIFNQAAKPIEARPILEYSTPDAADQYSVTLRFIEV